VIKKNNIILIQGVFEPSFFDLIKKKRGKEFFILEGRPGLEAAKRSSRELIKRKMKPTLIADNMAGFLFYKNLVNEVWLSYQFIDKKGALCQIGGLILGVLGRRHKVPVCLYPSGQKLQLLGRPKEISSFNGRRVAPSNIPGYVPLVEWVPKKYIGKVYGK
ncbi:MAG: hypothetical protein KAS66_14820, partial [Candidatus Omnitrophica bacterium]|nr:hypothetical protein [Candidatus Omnitrophota bacterium]